MKKTIDQDILAKLKNYPEIYYHVARGKRTKADLSNALKEEGNRAESTIYEHVGKVFKGNYPLLKVEGDTIVLDEDAAKEFILCIGSCFDINLVEVPKLKNKSQISRMDDLKEEEITGTSPQFKKIQKENARLRTTVKQQGEKIKVLEERLIKAETGAIISSMDKSVKIETVESEPVDALQKAYFMDHPGDLLDVPKLLSHYGGVRSSFYVPNADEDAELSEERYKKRMGKILFGGKILEKICKLQEEFRKSKCMEENKTRDGSLVSDKEIYKKRLEAINELLHDEKLPNQVKLGIYASCYEYRGTEMEELLEYAGTLGLDANYVIRLLERPMDFHNYHNIRSYLSQGRKSSEAMIKMQTVKELIAGDFFVRAEYCGKMCKFQMVPVDELIEFRKLLDGAEFSEAKKKISKIIGNKEESDPQLDESQVEEKEQSDEAYYEQVTSMIHEFEKNAGVNVHEKVDEDIALDDFAEGGGTEDGN